MTEKILDKGTIPFQIQARLLQELGERLVASPEVALVELIKNAYDADSPTCNVKLETRRGRDYLVVTDRGHGMTFDEFKTKWMRIATLSKITDRISRTYKRRLTGAKGIGRFAVRYLGDELTVITVAIDQQRRSRTRLTAKFDWPAIDRLADLRDAEIDYTLEQVGNDVQLGTSLVIGRLKAATDFARKSSLRADVLRIVTPIQGLEPGRFGGTTNNKRIDPGFSVSLPGDSDTEQEVNLAEKVLANAWARLQIELKSNRLIFSVSFPNLRKPRTFDVKVNTSLSQGFIADIRYFPRRKGIFQSKGVKGQVAWQWVRENHGVAVVDHGFRIVPYGYQSDDWLQLDFDKTHHRRNWRSAIAQKEFPISNLIRNKPDENPTFYIANNLQLVGAVFVESVPPSSSSEDLIPSMDREGFLRNRAFEELKEFVRAGIEFLALQDKIEIDKRQSAEAREAAASARQDIKDAIDYIKTSPTLTAGDKSRITKAYMTLATRLEEVEEYNTQAQRSLMNMSLLGVVAGFMTHETNGLLFELEKASKEISVLASKHASLRKVAVDLTDRLASLKGQLEYSRMFLNGVRRNETSSMSAIGQIRLVLRRFQSFAEEHKIKVVAAVPSEVRTPKLHPAVYSGIILNLYTNALKAILSTSASIKEPKIAIRAWNENSNHYVEVSDNGVGIPPQLRKRIWDPLYTTTSSSGNPLGSGMGLGLSLVKHVVNDNGGRIVLTDDPPPGFTTSFRVSLPMEQ